MNSKIKTFEHIRDVQINLISFAQELLNRALRHDMSKLVEPECSAFESVTEKLNKLEYGSEEYKQSLAELGAALQHHYSQNRHHPEHYKNGMSDFDLLDLVEMFCDWAAATVRHETGCLEKSIEINQERFKYPDMVKNIFINSVCSMPIKKLKK